MWGWLALGWLLAAASALLAWSFQREACYEIEESRAVRDALCETRAALKQSAEELLAVQQTREQLEAKVQQEQLTTV